MVFINKKVGGKMPIDFFDANAFYMLANQLGAPVSFKDAIASVRETTYHPRNDTLTW